LPVIYDKLEFL